MTGSFPMSVHIVLTEGGKITKKVNRSLLCTVTVFILIYSTACLPSSL